MWAITFLCIDYKITTKALGNHLLHVLPLIIHSDQSCGVRGRNRTMNNYLMQNTVDDINQCGLGGAVLS